MPRYPTSFARWGHRSRAELTRWVDVFEIPKSIQLVQVKKMYELFSLPRSEFDTHAPHLRCFPPPTPDIYFRTHSHSTQSLWSFEFLSFSHSKSWLHLCNYEGVRIISYASHMSVLGCCFFLHSCVWLLRKHHLFRKKSIWSCSR